MTFVQNITTTLTKDILLLAKENKIMLSHALIVGIKVLKAIQDDEDKIYSSHLINLIDNHSDLNIKKDIVLSERYKFNKEKQKNSILRKQIKQNNKSTQSFHGYHMLGR